MKKILLIVAGAVVVLFAAVLAAPRLFQRKQCLLGMDDVLWVTGNG